METLFTTLVDQPAQFMQTVMFYALSAIMLFAGLMVVSSKNAVHAVLFLILAFFNAAGLFVLLGAEFVAMLLIIVYVGAVAVLFLFVVMMLDIRDIAIKQRFRAYMPVGLLAVAVVACEGIMLAVTWAAGSGVDKAAAHHTDAEVQNTVALGHILYTYYLIPFQVAGLLLLVAMIGAIVLTHRQLEGTKHQKIADQVYRNPQNVLKINSVNTGEGA